MWYLKKIDAKLIKEFVSKKRHEQNIEIFYRKIINID